MVALVYILQGHCDVTIAIEPYILDMSEKSQAEITPSAKNGNTRSEPFTEKSPGHDDISIREERSPEATVDQWSAPQDWVERLKEEYSSDHVKEALPPGSDLDRVAHAILNMDEDESVAMLRTVIENHHQDYNFDVGLMERCKLLVEGEKACEMGHDEWAYETCKTAGMIHNWSPYTEVRAGA